MIQEESSEAKRLFGRPPQLMLNIGGTLVAVSLNRLGNTKANAEDSWMMAPAIISAVAESREAIMFSTASFLHKINRGLLFWDSDGEAIAPITTDC